VGKSTVALAAALAAARDGRRVVLCEVAGQARAAGLYGVDAPRPGRELQLEDGLWSTTIDPVVALEEWAGRQIGSRRLVGLLTHSNVFAAFVNAAPGARELVAITKAWELAQSERWVKGMRGYDLVVLDGPASGHGVGLLRTPHTFAEIARVGPIATQARKVVAMLEDPRRSTIVGVALPAELSVSETLDLEQRVAGAVGRPLDAVVVNAVAPRRFSAAEVDRLLSRDGEVPAAMAAAARRQHGQASTQQSQLRRLRRHTSAHVMTLPHVAAPHLGLAEVRTLADELARRL
jgi:anion-transporting  ArsA/GET3 family ATPase